MAQGKTVLAKKTGSGGRGASGNLKKGRRVIAPKSRVEINHKVMQKSLSAKINNSIERQMVTAASTGKLTILKNTTPDTRPESWSKKAVEARKAEKSGASSSKK